MPAPFATPADSARRLHDEPLQPDGHPFRIDRDRILRCTAFRRLDFKTQVFVPHEHDHVRTRLTHTLEVAQVARNLARDLDLNEDLAEAVALAHDLGHPPFGHVGEAVLDDLMRNAGQEGFEHNRQSLRIVDYLEHPFPTFRGLNLAQPTRCCLAKHETRYDAPTDAEFAHLALAPLEGQVVDLADEIAYTTADLEDALVAGWLIESDLRDQPLWQRAWAFAEQHWPGARPIHKRIRANAAVLELLCSDALDQTRENLQTVHIDNPESAPSNRTVALPEESAEQLDALQQLLLQRVYKHPVLVSQETLAEGILRDLFAHYAGKPAELPARYARRIDPPPPDDPTGGGLYRVLCDYIAGMTDRFCRAEHARLFNPA
jgi:dGTPase